MRQLVPIAMTTLVLLACGGSQKVPSASVEAAPQAAPQATSDPEATPAAPAAASNTKPDAPGGNEFVLNNSDTAKAAQGVSASKIKPTRTEAAMKFIVIDKDKGPMEGVVISLTAPNGTKYYTEETDSKGYAEVLVPVGQKYELVYLSLANRDIAAKVAVDNEPNQNVKLTLRYKRPMLPDRPADAAGAPRFVLKGVNFDTGKATIRPESFPRLDSVVEYMTHKRSARIEISGHTDNVGNPKGNKALSQKRAQACRDYLASKGIDADRIQAKGYGDEMPIDSNDSEEGRQKNRRIEATEL